MLFRSVGPGLHAHPRSKPLRFSSQVLHKGADSVGPVCCATLSGDQVLGECALSRWGGTAYRLPRPSCSVSWVRSESTVSGVLCVFSGELISGCDPPGGCQPSRIPGRLDLQLGPCSQFGRGCLLPSWLWLSPTCLPASGEGWASLLPVALLWYLLSPVSFECTWHCLRLEFFSGKFCLSLSFFFSSLSGNPSVWVAISG